jgi:hypothetical protein
MTGQSAINPAVRHEEDPLRFVIGRNRAGLWVVVEGHGLYGGIFGDERAAARYAKFEAAGRRSLIAICAEPIELYEGVRRAA